ncbi:hypothetical protein [Dactylosporangium matsuzakiense]|uniref:Uncharacterized protein n=1 Tax=Dactylosporangium matsuzakiense TaxID=53360 RepID=A0A9W6KGD8_9ACTN|nr:hypothetical protein [Dactylosporangium matsuzakiense]UWZ50227.1 hypothetical protein Dmats_25505 [Dactylosporangium matsuzakiense]GLL01028.1 hypothetical protein GCM10017581_027690 [Dactylosporangium matsuzakiense]
MDSSVQPGRRLVPVVLGAVALVAVVVEAVAAANPGRYIVLVPAGRPAVVAVVLAAALVVAGVAVGLLVRRTVAAKVVAGGTAVVALVVVCWGIEVGRANDGRQRGETDLVAVSPDGRFELVLVHYPSSEAPRDYLRLRSRDGVGTRESGQSLACFSKQYDVNAPEDQFGQASFVAEREVEIWAAAGEPFRTTFDPASLNAGATWSRGCDA